MRLNSLGELLVHELKDLYSAENQLIKALPKMAKATSSAELRAALEEHLEVTRAQVERLDKVFDHLGVSLRGKKCKAMEGLIQEGCIPKQWSCRI
jgi:ferritin-like metal-binding protein YciE